MIDEKKIEAAKEEIYEDIFLLNGEDVTGVTMQKLLKSPVGFILMICSQR